MSTGDFGDAKQCGMDFLSTRKFVRQTFGDQALRALGDKLAPQGYAGAVGDVILPDEWRPLIEYDALIGTVELMFPQSARKLGRFQCQDQVRWWQRGAMRILRPAWLIENAMALWGRYCTVGRWEVRWLRPTQATTIMHEMPMVSAAYCLTVSGFFERFLELCGRREIRSLHTTCRQRGDAECRHDVSWR